MRSMTGYGRAELVYEGWLVAVELTGVNRKQADIVVNMPNRLAAAESDVRKRIAARISRGRINARVTVEPNGGGRREEGQSAKQQLQFDRELAEQYLKAIDSLSTTRAPVDLIAPVDLLRAPGVFSLVESTVDSGEVMPTVFAVVDEALAALLEMQDTEGAHLAADFAERLDFIAKTKAAIAERAPQVVVRYRENLLARLEQAGLESMDLASDDRVLREIALFADRCEISEELTRIDSHLQQFRTYLQAAAAVAGKTAEDAEAGEAIGRPLDFLCQELNREFNTIGSKANDPEISRNVVELKTELEKVREQVQNVQ